MKFVSLFTGIGGFDLGFEKAGLQCVAQFEFDDNCRKLLGKKFSALVLDDVLKIAAAWRRVRRNKKGIDHEAWNRIFTVLRSAAVWCGGFPCQDVSVAGARAGLAGERSGLWFAFRRLLGLFRPAWVVIENVPGLLSSNSGRDIGEIFRGLEKLGYRWAYRTIDAQYLGVAQRRERVFIVASLGGFGCAEVLFERDSVCGNSPPRREAGQRPARPIAACSPDGSGYRNDADTADNLIPAIVGTLSDGAHHGGGSTVRTHTPDESSLPSVAWALQERDAKGADSSTKDGHLIPTRRGGFFDVADPICANEQSTWSHAGNNAGKTHNILPVAFSSKDHGADAGELSPTLRACGHSESHANGVGPPAMAFKASHFTRGKDGAPSEVFPPLSADADKGDQDPLVQQSGYGVRRLTPRECERLMGFPDDHTAGFADSVRYRMLGNSIVVQVAEWIGKRIVRYADSLEV